MPKLIDLSGQRFGRLVVVDRAPNAYTSRGIQRTCWSAVCDCGATVVVRQGQLSQGRTASCGCRKREAGGRRRTPGVPTYNAQHFRIAAERGKASGSSCVDCGSRAKDWSYIGDCSDELTSPEGCPYCVHVTHYVARCKACHIAADRVRDTSGRLLPRPAEVSAR